MNGKPGLRAAMPMSGFCMWPGLEGKGHAYCSSKVCVCKCHPRNAGQDEIVLTSEEPAVGQLWIKTLGGRPWTLEKITKEREASVAHMRSEGGSYQYPDLEVLKESWTQVENEKENDTMTAADYEEKY